MNDALFKAILSMDSPRISFRNSGNDGGGD